MSKKLSLWQRIKKFFKSEDVEGEEEPTDTLKDNINKEDIDEVVNQEDVTEEESVDIVDEKFKEERKDDAETID